MPKSKPLAEELEVFAALVPKDGESLDDWMRRCEDARFDAQDADWICVRCRLSAECKTLEIVGYPPD